jgi:predicted alpha/beta hydrolase
MTESGRTAIAGRIKAARQRSPGIFAIELGRPVPGQASVVFIPALGVAVNYYRPLLRAWEEAGRHVLAVESRGTGATPRELKRQGFGYRHLLSDLVDAVSHSSAGAEPVVVGHSLGGQLALLATATKQVNPSLVVTIASGSSQVPRDRPMAERIRRAIEIATIQALSTSLGWWPGDFLGFANRQPRDVMKDWAYEARHGTYRLLGDQNDYEQALRELTQQVLLVAVDGDPLIPRWAVERLARRLGSNATVYTLPAAAADHFRWARQEPGHVVRAIEEQISHGACLMPGVTAPPVLRPKKVR